MTFANVLIDFFNHLRDAEECQFWQCPLTGDKPHADSCLTSNPTGEEL